MNTLTATSLLTVFAVASTAFAQSTATTPNVSGGTTPSSPPDVDRSAYNLFHPDPPAQMRDFVPDRPTVTDGPYTVDPGHFLLEVGLFEYARDRYNPGNNRLDGFTVGDTNLRIGVLGNAEVDFLMAAYSYVRTKDNVSGAHLKQSGPGDLTLRSKVNLYGNDGGSVAVGLIPFVTLPTGRNGIGNRGFSGGVGLPVQFALSGGFQLAMETTVQSVHQPGGGSFFDYLNSVSLGHSLTKKLSTYVEFVADLSTVAHTGWIGTFDTGLTYQAGANWELDTGVEFGVTKEANDSFTFIGAAWRY
ncbi:MAG TPA: transporter [Chthoniobacterales bacterium]